MSRHPTRPIADAWGDPARELRTEPLTDAVWPAVVACLNIWNDRPALEQTLRTWLAYVDAVVVADGPYEGVSDAPESTDGLRALLAPTGARFLPCQVWATQCEKRTALLQTASRWYPGALLLIVDADESVTNGHHLRCAPEGDVLWVPVTSSMYRDPQSQPRLVRARPDLEYRGRHHWLYAGDRLLATHQYGGPGFEHRLARISLTNRRGLRQDAERRAVKSAQRLRQAAIEVTRRSGVSDASDERCGARDALRILACTTHDAGLAGFRLATAISTTTPHSTVFALGGEEHPFGSLAQIRLDAHNTALGMRLAKEADVIHCHLNLKLLAPLQVERQPVVIHHHGSKLRSRTPSQSAIQDRRACLRLVSTLELLSYALSGAMPLHWLPNPVSVARLRRLRLQVATRDWMPRSLMENAGMKLLVGGEDYAFRVAHSPSKREFKGTAEFLAACEHLQAKGLAIEPVLIEGQPHHESLRLKATCDAAFDSFWLGIQCSGLEAGAMGLPVIAGDATVRDRYLDLVGSVPYTFAADGPELESVLERMAADHAWREAEAARVSAYVETWHDDAAVALRYLDLLDDAIGWRASKTLTPTTRSA